MSKKLAIFFILLVAFMISGCASLNGNIPFQYQPSLVASNQRINKTVGLNMLSDMRPKGDQSYTESIKDISEKMTAKILEDFEKSKIFKEVHYPSQADDDIVINGTINRFMWKMYANFASYIPLLPYFGVPCYDTYGIADITFVIKDNKTGSTLGTFTESSRVETSYSLYNFKAGDAGAELADAFRDTVKKLKEDLLMKANLK